MGAAPLALRCLLHVRVQTDHVISSGTGVAQNDLPPLLADLTVVLVVRLVSIAVFGLHCEQTFERASVQRGDVGSTQAGTLYLSGQTFLLFLGALRLLLRTAAAIGAVGHGETPVVKVAVDLGFIFVALTESERQR